MAHNPDSQRTEDSIGTARYMAPEQWQGKPLTATDQYALGIIVYEWLCGECPFSGNTLQLMYQHTQIPPPRLREKVPTISTEVEQVVMTALAKDPKQRFASVRAFANALEQACQKPALGTLICTYHGHSFSSISQFNLEIYQKVLSNIYFRYSCPVWTVAWSPHGTHIASGSYNVHIWNASTGNHIISYGNISAATIPSIIVKFVTWSPDGTRVAFGYPGGEAQIYDISRGNVVTTYRGHTRSVNAVAWSPDSTRVASASSDETVHVWQAV